MTFSLKALVLFLTLVPWFSLSQESLSYADSFEIKSTVLKESRRYSVYLPPSYHNEGDKRYPVIFVLDGDRSRLLSISGVVEALSTSTLARQIDEFIIVAIPNTYRDRDLTPTSTDLIFKGKELAKVNGSGGADQFIGFIKKELLPRIDKTFRTNGQNTLVGMSFGGLFAAHTLVTQPELFNNYLILDATYVWDNNYLNRMLRQSTYDFSTAKIKVYLALANNDHIGEHGEVNRKWGNDFITQLQSKSSENFMIYSQYFPKERHGTIEMLGWYNGFLKLFGTHG